LCGIAGVIALNGRNLGPQHGAAVASMVDQMTHRGPDSKGVSSYPRTILGGCRLAILGLETLSNQPLQSPDSEVVIVFNGEIYNFLELRDELRALGHSFVSTGDTEVIVHAYEQWKDKCVERFNGMFAFAIFDPGADRIFFARDRFGVKPFYYVLSSGFFAFASEPIPLIRCGLATSTLDDHTVAEYLRFGVTDTSERTFFREISQLKPGHCGAIDGSEVKMCSWYDPSSATSGIDSGPALPAVKATLFRKLFESSVSLRMRSDFPVGILLSGGIDSSCILGVTARLFDPSTLRAYCVSFPGSEVDESRYAEATAKAVSVPLDIESAGAIDVEAVRQCIQAQQEPVISPSVVAQWLVMKAVGQSGIKVLLSGQGSDEYLAGYEYFDAYAVFDAVLRLEFGEALRHLLHERNARRIGSILAQVAFLLLPGNAASGFWRKAWLRKPGGRDQQSPYVGTLGASKRFRSAQLFHLRMRLPELLRYEDRNSMAFSIETRHPFLDYRLVDLSLGYSTDLLVGDGMRKLILRRALGDVLIPQVAARTDKIGFQTPTNWLRSDIFLSSFYDLIETAGTEPNRFIDFGRVRRLLKRARTGSARRTKDLWRIYNFLAWFRELPASHPIQSTADRHSMAEVIG
jgi:asparagine synthase (glutamine-hydrolysing)